MYYSCYIFYTLTNIIIVNVNFRCLREMNDNRKEIDIQIAEGTITKLDMMHQLKIEMHIIDLLIKKIDVSFCLLYTIIPNHLY